MSSGLQRQPLRFQLTHTKVNTKEAMQFRMNGVRCLRAGQGQGWTVWMMVKQLPQRYSSHFRRRPGCAHTRTVGRSFAAC